MTVVPHAGSRRTVLKRTAPAARASRTGVMSSSAFVIGSVAVMSLGLLVLLVLNTALAKGSFRVHELRIQTADLAQREQLLRTQIQNASSPVTLAKRAKDLGLVAAATPVFIRLSDGQILGEAFPAGAPIDPVTGQLSTTVAPVTPGVVPSPDPAATAPAPAATTPAEPVPVAPSPGVATTPGTDTEQPLGITGR
ncbi:MAG: hypothetical protein MUF33_04770 [Candidatus Nanopelagicales bacterium]|jgi:hypothetical protein|nr:hypothetical protein [Candidatus Nanopelagicales bacterium]MCU0297819.1 hypothetical protein [Candidatus Nanopelagicales bacterium]